MYQCEVVSKPEHVLSHVTRHISYISVVNLGWQHIKCHILDLGNKNLGLNGITYESFVCIFSRLYFHNCQGCVHNYNDLSCI